MVSEAGAPQRVLWGIGTSRTVRAHWALQELQLAYRTQRVRTRTGDTETATFTRINPRQKIPVLCDGDLTISESAAIVTYLGERYPGPDGALMPADVAQRARYFEWMSFICMELDATSLYVLRRHEYLPQIYGDSPVANDAAKAYFKRMIDAAALLHDDSRAFLLGPRFSGVDILMTTCLSWAVVYDQPLPDVFAAYLDRLLERPAYARAVQANDGS